MNEIIREAMPYVVSFLALLYTAGNSIVQRYRLSNEALEERINARAAEREIELERDRGDLRTREVVDDLLARYIRRHDELAEALERERAEAAKRDADHIRQIDELTTTFQVALSQAEAEFNQRLRALERALAEKDAYIEDLKRRLSDKESP